MDKNKLLSKKIQVGFKNAEISSLTSKNNNSMLNLISIPKSSENTASHRMIYKKPTFDNKKEMNEPQISLVSNKMMKPRVLKSTTPYKSEKKQLNIKKLSEKEMHFEDINNFAVIYKYDDNEKNKLPSIKPMFNSGQISLNNTFNPLKSKIGIDIKELTFTDKKPVNNQSNLNLIVSAKMNPTITKQVININKANILTEYFPFDKTGSDKQLEKKSNQNNKTTKLEPLIYLEPAPKIFSEKSKSSSEKEPSSLQKNRFPKDVFCLNIPKKYIV